MPAQEEFESLPADVEYDRALDKALKLLTIRSRSRSELRDRLGRNGFGEDVIEKVDARLTELGLVDDLAFAKEWGSQAIAGRGLSSQRIQLELATRGVPKALTEEALPEAPSGDFDRALGLARRRALTYGGLPKQTAYRRLEGFLGQRGYEEDLIAEVCSRVLGDPEATETPGN